MRDPDIHEEPLFSTVNQDRLSGVNVARRFFSRVSGQADGQICCRKNMQPVRTGLSLRGVGAMEKCRAPALHLTAVGFALVSLLTANVSSADLFSDCGIQNPDVLRHKKVAIVSISGNSVRTLDPATGKRTDERISKGKLIQSGVTIRDSRGYICLKKANQKGHIWTYSSVVNYRCTPLADQASDGEGMPLGAGGCKDDEY